ncbi:transcriptional regulator, LysR family [Cellvibrio japonicus Ueda107]|uniref:Transcriptional regulator, LysR family n=2 Tax=Cellvibrio japonicus TaxID=155077 RepID=B3PH14_CELJU|nr:LysR substrate-binding domain-containing protein [Cellvibrio japonicus]ACE83565.1 transcriptional regulator, LysR family [Cellvibrio japonicus Ueda107]QEI13813.1 LysR family transcriptional regulator [Cellvibrio japonicus]QEI17387.1 LysR family transcriptional regulator [Cellvibrio japonicus]QEI20963.1 LysR family transcriptional regulator [Cellvibrio japonicus]
MHHAITLEALRVLDMIDKKGSFGAAAEALFKVPSALSYTVQKLESDLGINLFDRSKQKARLTAAGRLLLEQGRQLLQAATAIEESVQQLESGWETQLRIAKDTVLPLAPLLLQINAFNQLDKRVAISISEEVLGGTWDALVAERCDLALGASGELPKGIFEYRQLGVVEFVFAVAPNHPLCLHQGPVDAAAIRAFPTIVIADSSVSTPGRSSGLLESRQVIRVANTQAKIQAQVMGVGVGFLPKHLVADELHNGSLIALDCSVPRPPIPLYLAWRKGNNGKALRWFVEACAATAWLD